jgi:hypothetical protein
MAKWVSSHNELQYGQRKNVVPLFNCCDSTGSVDSHGEVEGLDILFFVVWYGT